MIVQNNSRHVIVLSVKFHTDHSKLNNNKKNDNFKKKTTKLSGLIM